MHQVRRTRRTVAISGSRPYANHTAGFYRESAASRCSQSNLGSRQLDRRDNASAAAASFSCARMARQPTTIQKSATPIVPNSVSAIDPLNKPTARASSTGVLFPMNAKPRPLRTVAISSSRPKDYPLRRTSSRVCCIALFCLSAPTNLSHRKSVFRTGWGPATVWTSAGKASLNLRGSVIQKI